MIKVCYKVQPDNTVNILMVKCRIKINFPTYRIKVRYKVHPDNTVDILVCVIAP